ncbi:MAG: M24 family metallopeptidase [Pseudomonadota bacterium]
MPDARIDRLRSLCTDQGVDALVLTDPHNVRYATGYHSVLERWTLREPLSAAIVPADAAAPVQLVIPEANVAILAVLADQGAPTREDEIRTFDMLNFCDVARAADPHAAASAIGEAAAALFAEKVRGACRADIVAAVAAALADHGLAGARLGVDDLRMGAKVADAASGPAIVDAYDPLIVARMVKTPDEHAAFRRVGAQGDAAVAFAAEQLEPGVTWDEVQYRIADFMVRRDIIPVDEGAVLFGGAFRGAFMPELFRTRCDRPLADGDIVILETQGVSEGFWIDINRTATLGAPSAPYQRLHDMIRDTFLTLVDAMKPGAHTGDLSRQGYEILKSKGVSAPEKFLVVAHGVGHMPLEIPVPFPAYGRAGADGFVIEKDMVVSLDCLHFGSEFGPCHMENVFIISDHGAESTYKTPLDLLGPR